MTRGEMKQAILNRWLNETNIGATEPIGWADMALEALETIGALRTGYEPDLYGRSWPNVTANERCHTCGQPDNCGDCNHDRLSDEQATQLGATNA